MSDKSIGFLICGLLLSALLVGGLLTGKMLSRYFVDDRDEQPFWFWVNAAVNAVLALLSFYMAWVDW
jgi:hypothetical protein